MSTSIVGQFLHFSAVDTELTVFAFGMRNSPGSSTSAVDVVKLLRKRHLSSNKNELKTTKTKSLSEKNAQNITCIVLQTLLYVNFHCILAFKQIELINPLISNITLQILLSCCHTLLLAETGRIFVLSTEFMLLLILSFIFMTSLTQKPFI